MLRSVQKHADSLSRKGVCANAHWGLTLRSASPAPHSSTVFVVRCYSPRVGCGSQASSGLALHGAHPALGDSGSGVRRCGAADALGPGCLGSAACPRTMHSSPVPPSSPCDTYGLSACPVGPLREPWQELRTGPGTVSGTRVLTGRRQGRGDQRRHGAECWSRFKNYLQFLFKYLNKT